MSMSAGIPPSSSSSTPVPGGSGSPSKKSEKKKKRNVPGLGRIGEDTGNKTPEETTITKVVIQPLVQHVNPLTSSVSADEANEFKLHRLQQIERTSEKEIQDADDQEIKHLEHDLEEEIEEVFNEVLQFNRDERKREEAKGEYDAVLEEKRLEEQNRKIDKEIEKRKS